MLTITAPILFGQQGPEVKNLQEILLWLISKNQLTLNDLNQADAISDEMQKSFFGSITLDILNILKTKLGGDMLFRGVSDQDAIKINTYLKLVQVGSSYITGRILNANGYPISGATVRLYNVYLNFREEVDGTNTDVNGYFKLQYEVYLNVGVQADIIIPELSEPLQSEIYFSVVDTIYFELTAPIDTASGIKSEFEIIEAAIARIPNPQSNTLTLDHVPFLSRATGENEVLIKLYILSIQFATKVQANANAFYGVLRITMLTSLEVVVSLSHETLTNALQSASNLNIIPNMTTESIAFQTGIMKSGTLLLILGSSDEVPSESRGYRVLSEALDGEQYISFLEYFSVIDTSNPRNWDTESLTGGTGLDDATVVKIKYMFGYALVTGNNPIMVGQFLSRTPEANAVLSRDLWRDIIAANVHAPDFVFPDYITGQNEEEKIDNYADSIKENFDGAFRNLALKQSIVTDAGTSFPGLKSDLNVFSTNNPQFDLLSTPVSSLNDENFDFTGVDNRDRFIEEAGTLQRLSIVTSSYTGIAALKNAGLTSSKAIVQQSQEDFAETFGGAMGGNAMAEIAYSNAINVVMMAQAAAVGAYQWLNFDVPAIYQPAPGSQSNMMSLMADSQPDWRSLFGTVDYCNCDNCTSVFSPLAYLVDSLELLRKYNLNAYKWLRARRPDLWNIKLTCKNTNTVLPYIDLTNELLEDMMDASGEDPVIPPVPYLYPIHARDTNLDEKTLNTIPEYIGNGSTPSAYDVLMGAKYPWTAPYNYYYEQTREYLGLINVRPYKLPQTFSATANAFTFQNINLACSYLGITKINPSSQAGEYFIITDNTTTNLRAYYGVTGANIIDPADRTQTKDVPPGSLVPTINPFLNRMDILMQQSGLTFTDILELLDCYYVNPITVLAPTIQRKLKIIGVPETSCDISLMVIEGLSENDLLAIHRFIRLQRKTGWTKYELDRVFATLGVPAATAITDSILIAVAQIKKLTEILNCSPDDILPFWGDMGYRPYSLYIGDKPQLLVTQYEQYFRNQAVVPNYDQISGYPFIADMAAWKANSAGVTTPISQSELDYVLGAFQISERDFDRLFNFYKSDGNLELVFVTDPLSGDFSFNYRNVLQLLREFTLIKLLQMSVPDWCLYRSWLKGLDIDPFVNSVDDQLSSTLLFIDKIATLRNSGITASNLHYLFDDRFMLDSDKGVKRKTLFSQYQSLRALLLKLNESVMLGTGDVDVKALLKKVGFALDPDDADFIVNYVANLSEQVGSAPFPFTTVDLNRLMELLPAELTPENKTAIAAQLIGAPPGSYTVTDKNERLLIVNGIYTLAALKGQIRNYLSTTYKIDLSIGESLLSQWIIAETDLHAYDILLDEAYINSVGNPDISQLYTRRVLLVIERFAKAALLVNADNFSASDIDFLIGNKDSLNIPDMANLPYGNAWGIVPDSVPVPVDSWMNMVEWLDARASMSPSPTGVFTVLQQVFDLEGSPSDTPDGRKEAWFEALIMAVQVNEADLGVLIGNKNSAAQTGLLNIDFVAGNPYLLPVTYRRLLACLGLRAELEVNMQSCLDITNAVLIASSQPAADYVVQSVKARYSNDEWLEQAKPANDKLRVGRRDAMVAHLLAYPPLHYRENWVSANDIFETLLTDTGMMPIVKTSRIKQAISVVQLFVDRCILQKEANLNGTLTLSADTIRQWNLWRKWYRIWEANRRIFIYPENWIEPDLRDDKSPFFKELEKFIKQNEITADTMADAYRTYLERLDEVSHLDIMGYFTENIVNGTTVTDTIVHVWGRTKANPHMYFYRKKVMGVWTAWEKMDTQIDGDNFAPVKWRGRLRLYWLTFTEQIKERVSKITVDEDTLPPEKYWKIELNWTELKNGRWLPKQVGKEWLETYPYGATRAKEIYDNYVNTHPWTASLRVYTLNTFKDSFTYLRESMTPYCRVNGDGDLEVIVHGRKKYILQPAFNTAYPGGQVNLGNADSLAESYYFSNFKYEEFKGRFTIKHNKVFADIVNLPHTFYDTLVENYPYRPDDSHYKYDRTKPNGYDHLISTNNSVKLLAQAPVFDNVPNPDKYLVFSKFVTEGSSGNYVPFPRFFYKDYRNSFYVEKITIGAAMVSQGGFAAGGFAAGMAMDAESEIAMEYLPAGGGYPGWLLGSYIEVAGGIGNLEVEVAEGNPILGGGTANIIPSSLAGTDYYRFYTFYYHRVNQLMDRLDRKGVAGLFDWDFIEKGQIDDPNVPDTYLNFSGIYQPTIAVMHYYPLSSTNDVYPKSKLDFSSDSPTAIYNWELFFHIPLLIANKLMQDQKFAEAMQWYHYVFNPTNKSGTTHGDGPERFWQFYPFYKESIQGIPPVQDLMTDPGLTAAVQRWANDPFKPHLVARTRLSAYMKNVLMKYLDNLVAWGDQLFRRDTMESINEATLLYIIAAQILGKAPVKVPRRAGVSPKSYDELITDLTNMNAFSNASVAVETVLAPTLVSQQFTNSPTNPLEVFYFCIPPNDKLLSYWDVVADRLFKIRNSQNIDGVERQLALFEPPIDPALLVRAAAAGVSLSDAVNELFAPLPQYRFVVMAQKATEMVQEVKGLGSSLLSALEKKDAEYLSLLRSSQELSVMEGVKEIRQYQLQEAQAQVAALEDQKAMVTLRRNHYNGLIEKGLNVNEQMQLDSVQASIPLRIAEASARTLSGIFYAVPEFKLASPFSLGTTYGGTNLGNLTSAAAAALGIAALVNDTQGSMAGIKGGYARRLEDWNLQLKLADGELKQVEKQLIAAEIREAIAEKEMKNQELQFNNALEMDAAMRDKYTNEELYDWMVGEISLTYFQSYKLAFDLAKRAERSYKYELGLEPTTPFIQFGYWDSLKKGLLAGERLSYDIRRMDSSYMEQNKRLHEMSKHISLAALDANVLIQLKAGQPVTINIPEWLFDMDYPGHYFRRIKAVSISIPCVAGPYSTVSAKLTLNNSKYRKNAISGSTPYPETPVGNDSRFAYMLGGGQSIATSAAQNDSGMFEMNFRDERYLPFEGAGVISQWTLELPSKYASFDANTISDVIIHIQYTAKFDGGLTEAANINLDMLMADAATGTKLPRLFSLRHEFSNAWYAYGNAFTDNPLARILMRINNADFPFYCKNKKITVDRFDVQLNPKNKLTGSYKLKITYFSDGYQTLPITLNATNKYGGNATIAENDPPFIINGNTKIIQLSLEKEDGSTVNMDQLLEDIYLVATYHLNNLDSTLPADDQPQPDIPLSTMVSWWKADAPENTTFAGRITNLKDLSGNGIDLIPYVSGNGPELITEGGIQYLDFQDSPLYDNTHVSAITGLDPFTFIYIGNSGWGKGTVDEWSIHVSGTIFSVCLTWGGWVIYPISNNGGAQNLFFGSLSQLPNYSSSTMNIYDNSGDVTNTENVANGYLRTFGQIGFLMGAAGSTSNYVNGKAYELLVYKKVLSLDERKALLAYLKSKYPFIS